MGTTDTSTPPLIILRGDEFVIPDVGTDIHSWLSKDTLRRSNAVVIHDPGRDLWNKYAIPLSSSHYVIKALDLTDIRHSERFNPFAYAHNNGDVKKLAAALLYGTKGLGRPGDVDFLSCETLLLTALIGYILTEAPCYEQNIETLTIMLENMMPEDHDEGYMTAVEYLLTDKEKQDPNHFAIRKYRDFLYAAGEDAWQIIESCVERLAPLNTPETLGLMSNDEVGLYSLAFPNTALFVIPGEPGAALNFLVPLMYSQLFSFLCE